jgi:replicative DNA helicase
MRTDVSREICEKGVLGSLCNKTLSPSMIKVEFFHDPINITIFKAIKVLHEKQLPYTYLDVYEYLERNGCTYPFEYVAVLGDSVPAFASQYLSTLEKYHNQRTLVVGIKDIYDNIISKDPEQIILELQTLTKLNYQNNLTPVSEKADEIYKEKVYEPMFKSGIKAIDTVVDYVPDTLHLIAGLPGTGKTSFCLNIINNVLNQNKKVLFFSLEMSDKKILNRLSAIRSNETINRMKEQPDLPRQISSVLTNFYLQCPYGCSFDRIFIDAMKVRPDLIVIDSSTRIITPNKYKNPTIHFTEVAEKGKELTRLLECPVILIVHMNRDIYNGKERDPLMSDLFGASTFEQQADIIQFLNQTEQSKDNERIDGSGIVKIDSIIVKNRDEITNKMVVEFNKPKCIFRD